MPAATSASGRETSGLHSQRRSSWDAAQQTERTRRVGGKVWITQQREQTEQTRHTTDWESLLNTGSPVCCYGSKDIDNSGATKVRAAAAISTSIYLWPQYLRVRVMPDHPLLLAAHLITSARIPEPSTRPVQKSHWKENYVKTRV